MRNPALGTTLLFWLCCTSVSAQVPRLYTGAYESQLSGPESDPQLVDAPSRAPRILGISLMIAGVVAVVADVALYAAETSVRLRPRSQLVQDDLDSFRALSMATFWVGFWGSAALVTGEALALPDTDSQLLPVLSGAVGLGAAAVGLGFWVGGTHCQPILSAPGSRIDRACLSATSDANFGALLVMASLPLMAPLVIYTLRKALAPTVSITMGPGALQVRGTF